MPRRKDTDDPAVNEKSVNEEHVAEEGSEGKRGRDHRPEELPENSGVAEGRSVGIGLPISPAEYARLKREADRKRRNEPDDLGQEDESD